jgi:hypothetical protein
MNCISILLGAGLECGFPCQDMSVSQSTSGTHKSMCSMSGKTDPARVTTMKRLGGQRSFPSSTRGPKTDMSQPEIELGWEASTLAKSYSNSL